MFSERAGRQIDDDPGIRERKSRRTHRSPDPLAGFEYRCVPESDNREGRKPVRYVDLNLDGDRLGPDHCSGSDDRLSPRGRHAVKAAR